MTPALAIPVHVHMHATLKDRLYVFVYMHSGACDNSAVDCAMGNYIRPVGVGRWFKHVL